MTQQDRVGSVAPGFLNDLRQGHRPELRVEEPGLVSGIEQWTAQRQQTQRRQVLVRYPAADRRMRRIEQEDSHKGPGLAGGRTARERREKGRLPTVRRLLCVTKY